MQFFYPPQPTRLWPNAPLFKRLDNDPNWIGEIKMNGWRLEIHKENDKLLFYNRHGTIIDINSDIFLPKFAKVPNDSILDGELVHFRTKDTKNKIVLWDVMFWAGRDIRKCILDERRSFLNAFEKDDYLSVGNDDILLQSIPPSVTQIKTQKTNLIKFYETVIKRNSPLEEGIVIKNINSPYESSLKRTFDTAQWFKIKKIDDSAKVTHK